jgi:hypothetical protein
MMGMNQKRTIRRILWMIKRTLKMEEKKVKTRAIWKMNQEQKERK